MSHQYPFYFVLSIILCFLFGFLFSIPSLWRRYFIYNESYLKAGEYGETEVAQDWSPWKEPINAWSSLFYSMFGLVILFVSASDYFYNNDDNSNSSNGNQELPINTLSTNPGFSVIIGMSCLYLGIASCFFHASHGEIWRKADAGMTSGVMAGPVIFGIWDRCCPPGISSITMLLCAVVIQFSFTHGYLPYGSSDILLPTLVAVAWGLELAPSFGGAVDQQEYIYWLQCCYGALGGMLLRAADIKRKTPSISFKLVFGFFGLTIFPFGWFVGYANYVIMIGFLAGLMVYFSPAKGHLFWHLGSSFALFIWWYLLRTRSGNPDLSHVSPTLIRFAGLVFFVVVKNGIRRLFMNLTSIPAELRNRLMFFLEHTFFAIWGWRVMVTIPGPEETWLLHPILCWSSPPYPSDEFHLFYQVKVATHTEDLIYILYSYVQDRRNRGQELPLGSSTAELEKQEKPHSDMKMNIHHIATAVLCIASYLTDYVRIGSIVMFLHDISDVPLDFVRISTALQWATGETIGFIASVLLWLYWRLWYFPTAVLYNIAMHSKSLLIPSPCRPGSCSWAEVPERTPFLLLLGTLQVLHIVWFWQLLSKGYRVLVGNGERSKK